MILYKITNYTLFYSLINVSETIISLLSKKRSGHGSNLLGILHFSYLKKFLYRRDERCKWGADLKPFYRFKQKSKFGGDMIFVS